MGAENDFMLVQSGAGQVLMAVPKVVPEDEEFSVRVFPASVKVQCSENLYYTQVHKHTGQMAGFQIDCSTLEATKIWDINFSASNGKDDLKNNHIIEEVITQNGFSSHILPTIFGEEGVLLYKFFDANFFAVMVSNADKPSQVSFHVVNSVSGHIVHQFTEQNVQRSNKSKVTAILSENVLAVSFQRQNVATGLSQQELTVTEFYKQK